MPYRFLILFFILFILLLLSSDVHFIVASSIGVSPPYARVVLTPGEEASFTIRIVGNATVYAKVVQTSGGEGCIVGIEPVRFTVIGDYDVIVKVKCFRPGTYSYRIFFYEEYYDGKKGVIVKPAVVFKLSVTAKGIRIDARSLNDSLLVYVSNHGVSVDSVTLTIYVNGVERFRKTVDVPSSLSISYESLGIGAGVYNVTMTASAGKVSSDSVVMAVSKRIGLASINASISSPKLALVVPGALVEFLLKITAHGNTTCSVRYAVFRENILFTGFEEIQPREVIERKFNIRFNPWSPLPYYTSIGAKLEYVCGIRSGETIKQVDVFVIPFGFILLMIGIIVVLLVLLFRLYARKTSLRN